MGEEYFTTYEAALAVVATGMKKARLPFHILVINLLFGGILFALGGMLQVMVEANNFGLEETNPGLNRMLAGFFYPIGLFFVVMMGVDLFNSNILFFSVAGCRRAVSGLDIFIGWMVSYWFNMVGNIFVCYIFVHFLGIFDSDVIKKYLADLVDLRANEPWHHTFIRAIAGNFYVCVGIYMQLLVRPLHVKLLMLFLPLFTFICLGFVHLIAEITIGVIGLINGANTSVGKVAYNLFLPALLGNIVGGCFLGVVMVWYLHLYTVEQDAKKLHLPKHEAKDIQPQIFMDLRIVREEMPDNPMDPTGDERVDAVMEDIRRTITGRLSSHTQLIARHPTSTSTLLRRVKSPRNVFPVAGMGAADDRERQLAGDDSDDSDPSEKNQLIGERVMRMVTNLRRKNPLISHRDIELHINLAFASPVSPASEPAESAFARVPDPEHEGASIQSSLPSST